MRKICVVLTARTSYAKIKPVLKAIQNHPDLTLQLICAGSALLPRYGDMAEILEQDGFKIDEYIYMVVEGGNLITSAKSTGLGLIEFATAFEKLNPDIVFVMADRYEQMAPAIAASYMNIPLAHAQGGEVSGNIDEKVRHAITKLADYHFPASKRAHDWVIRMGENPSHVFLSGCPSTDICKNITKDPDWDFDIYDKYGGVGAKPELNKSYIIVMQHPVTTEFYDASTQATETLKAIHALNIPTLWFWPNVDAGSDSTAKAIRHYREQNAIENIHFFRNMAPHDFLKVLNKASVIVGNSSCAIREASFLGVPAVNIGSRQSDREQADNVVNTTYDQKEIEAAIKTQLEKPRPVSSTLYGEGHAAGIIVESLAKAPLRFDKKLGYLAEDDTGHISEKSHIQL